MPTAELSNKQKQRATFVFNAIDVDESGVLERAELGPLVGQDLTGYVRAIDVGDDDGKISMVEWMEWNDKVKKTLTLTRTLTLTLMER